MSLWTRLYHIKLKFFGDTQVEKNGKKIPCKRCGNRFNARDFSYETDALCRDCNLIMGTGLFDKRGRYICTKN